MLKYILRESHDGSLFVITSLKENLFGLHFQKKDIEVRDFDDDYLQDRMVEVALVKFSIEKSHCIKSVIETCQGIFNQLISGNLKDKILYVTTETDTARSKLVERIAKNNNDKSVVRFRIQNLSGQNFYFVFNEEHTSTVEVINSLIIYFKKEYDIDLTWNAKGE